MARFFGDGLAMPRETLRSRRRGKALRTQGETGVAPLTACHPMVEVVRALTCHHIVGVVEIESQ